MIYLDYNATTPIDPEVAQEMLPFIHEHFGNPSSTHSLGQTAKLAVEKARGAVRFSLGKGTSKHEIDEVLHRLEVLSKNQKGDQL